MTSNFSELPPDLPIPSDDGQARHVQGLNLPHILFPSTAGADVDIGAISGLLVIYVYPMTGRPGVALPEGWDSIPGARGCTPQSCSFRDHYAELRSLNAVVFGLSAQTREYQQEAKQRLHLPFDLLSDVLAEAAHSFVVADVSRRGNAALQAPYFDRARRSHRESVLPCLSA